MVGSWGSLAVCVSTVQLPFKQQLQTLSLGQKNLIERAGFMNQKSSGF